MTIGEIIRQGFHYARNCRSLWLFGFVVGIASGGSNGGVGAGDRPGAGDAAAGGWPPFSLSAAERTASVVAIVIAALAAIVMRFISEGALIEGVVRARQGGAMTTGEAFGAGRKHWGVLLRIGLLYVAAFIGSLVLLAVPAVLAGLAFGPLGAAALGIPALVAAVPWFITLHLVQAFASRIAVLENRRALDAIRKSRLFLHGRIRHGLRLIVAALVGALVIGILSVVVILPVVLLLIALLPVLGLVPVIVIGCLVLLPAIYVLVAMLGTYRSSIWTIGYVTEVEA